MLAHAEETIPPRRVDVADILDPHRLAGPELRLAMWSSAGRPGRTRVWEVLPKPTQGGRVQVHPLDASGQYVDQLAVTKEAETSLLPQ